MKTRCLKTVGTTVNPAFSNYTLIPQYKKNSRTYPSTLPLTSHNSNNNTSAHFSELSRQIDFQKKRYVNIQQQAYRGWDHWTWIPEMVMGRFAGTVLVLLSLTVCALAARNLAENYDSFPEVPASIAVSEKNYKLVQTVFAKGHQHYRFNGTSWVQFNATAKLYNPASNKDIGRHFFLPERDALGGQPTWQSLSSKGVPFSSVTCKSVSSVVVDVDSIAWVLLEATQSEGSKKYFGDVVRVQRYKTKGGLAPNSKEAPLGATKKSKYTTFYSFYVYASKH